MISTLARALAIAVIAIGPVRAGTLDHGNWSPTGCGPEPTAPTGLNLSSADAYKDSVKWVKAYEDQFNKYSDCMVQEANRDNSAINDYVNGTQHKAQEFFDKVSGDSKRAQSVLSPAPSKGNGDRRSGSVGISSQSPPQ